MGGRTSAEKGKGAAPHTRRPFVEANLTKNGQALSWWASRVSPISESANLHIWPCRTSTISLYFASLSPFTLAEPRDTPMLPGREV